MLDSHVALHLFAQPKQHGQNNLLCFFRLQTSKNSQAQENVLVVTGNFQPIHHEFTSPVRIGSQYICSRVSSFVSSFFSLFYSSYLLHILKPPDTTQVINII